MKVNVLLQECELDYCRDVQPRGFFYFSGVYNTVGDTMAEEYSRKIFRGEDCVNIIIILFSSVQIYGHIHSWCTRLLAPPSPAGV